MASSSSMRKYPKRLYEVGKTPSQSRSMNRSCYLANIQAIKEAVGEDVWNKLRESSIGVIVKLAEMEYIWSAKAVGEDVWNKLRESSIGVIVKLAEMEYIWSAKAVHYFLTNQLAIQSMHEIWSLIDCMPVRFSLYEFEEIIGLSCDAFDEHDVWNVDHRDFWLEMKVKTSEGPTLKELQAIFPICRNWSREKRVMVGLLGLLSIGIYGISSNSRIPLHCAKRVMDTAAFQRYPWGRIGFSSLVESIKIITLC